LFKKGYFVDNVCDLAEKLDQHEKEDQ